MFTWFVLSCAFVIFLLLGTTRIGFELIESYGVPFEVFLFFLSASVFTSCIQLLVAATMLWRTGKDELGLHSYKLTKRTCLISVVGVNVFWSAYFLIRFYLAMSEI